MKIEKRKREKNGKRQVIIFIKEKLISYYY